MVIYAPLPPWVKECRFDGIVYRNSLHQENSENKGSDNQNDVTPSILGSVIEVAG